MYRECIGNVYGIYKECIGNVYEISSGISSGISSFLNFLSLLIVSLEKSFFTFVPLKKLKNENINEK